MNEPRPRPATAIHWMEDAIQDTLDVDAAKARSAALAVWKALEGSGHRIVATPPGFDWVLTKQEPT